MISRYAILILGSVAIGLVIPDWWSWQAVLFFSAVIGIAYGFLFRKPKKA